MVRNSIIPHTQCIFDLNGSREFRINEFAELAANGDFIDTTESIREMLTEPLPVKKIQVQAPNEENKLVPRMISVAEVRRHTRGGDCWTIFRKKVYDITKFVAKHPGGEAIMAAAGIDCEAMAQAQHSWVDIEASLQQYYIGELGEVTKFKRSST